jgi:hypothetical protein
MESETGRQAARVDVVRFPHPRGYVCPRASRPPRLSGRIDDPVWDAAPWTDDFVDIEGDAKPKPRHRTRLKMMWDESAWYLAVEMEEPNVWATLTEHDSVIFQDNDFEFFVDPDGDNHDYFEYEINALGTDWDLRLPKPYRDGGPALNEWEIPGLRKAVWVDGTLNDPADADRGWRLELAVPWAAFDEHAGCPCPPRVGDRWRVNFSRVEWDVEPGTTRKVAGRPEHNWVWSPQHAIDMHRPELWGYLEFAEASGAFSEDPDWGLRCDLMDVYWRQRAWREAKGVYADSLVELGFEGQDLTLRTVGEGWSCEALGVGGLLVVRQDSRLTVTDPSTA